MECKLCDSHRHTRGCCPQFFEHTKTPTSEALWASVSGGVRLINPFVKVVQLNGHTVSGLINTGCTIVLVRSTAAKDSSIHVVQDRTPLYTVTDSNQPSTTTIGKAVDDVCVDGVVDGEHDIMVVSGHDVPVYILIGYVCLLVMVLPHVSYYKQGFNFVIETNNTLDKQVLHQQPLPELAEVFIAEVVADGPFGSPITVHDIKVGPQATAVQLGKLITLVNRDTFAKNLAELGCTNVLTMDIVEN